MAGGAFPSFDQQWAANSFGSEQCASYEVPISTAIRVIQLGPVSSETQKGLREEFWRASIDVGAANPTERVQFIFRADASDIPTTPEFTPSTSWPPTEFLINRPANLDIGLRVPEGKPYLFYKWTGGGGDSDVLILTRYAPQRVG